MHNWDDFRFFYAVARHGSLSGAAKELGVNHTTVSRRIQILEEKHGVRLLNRVQSGYELTDAGEAVFDLVEKVNSKVVQTSRVLMGQDTRLAGSINLTMPHELYNWCFMEPLQAFTKQYPAIELNMIVSKGIRNLTNREADVAVRLTPTPPDYLVGKRFARMQHGIYRSRHLEIGEFTPIVVWHFEKDVPEWAKKHIQNPKIALRIDDLFSLYNAVQNGFGVARMPCFLPDKINHPEVECLPIPLPLSDWGVWLLSHVDLKKTARISCLKRVLADHLAGLQPLFEGKLSENSRLA